MDILKVENISKSFDNKQIIDNINMYIEKGELISLLGVSGVGKSTLFNIIAGVLSPSSGKIIFEGSDITNKSGYISYMLQKDLLLEHKTIIDNVSLPLVIKGMSKNQARSKSQTYFDIFGLTDCEKLYPKELSGGMRQRAALLRTYLFSDHLALLDEPFSALDTITKSEMHTWYLGIMKKIKLSTIFITHDIDEAILLSDRIYIMNGNPGTIGDEIIIDKSLSNKDGFSLSSDFLAYKKIVIECLNKKTVGI